MIPFKDNIPSKTFPFVNIVLILINLGVFGYELSLASSGKLDAFLARWSLIPIDFMLHPFKNAGNLLLSMFFHGGWIHLLANMFYLAIFGRNVEDRVGHFRYIIFYLLCGTIAFIFQILNNPLSEISLIGASGAIAGVLGAYFILYPWAKIRSLIIIYFFEIPAFLFLGMWFFIQILNSYLSITTDPIKGCTGEIAWWAHIGGFVSGVILIFFFRKNKYYRALY